MSIEVKVIRTPGKVYNTSLEEGATVGDALMAADVHLAPGEKVTLSGQQVDGSQRVSDGDRVIVSKGAKGA